MYGDWWGDLIFWHQGWEWNEAKQYSLVYGPSLAGPNYSLKKQSFVFVLDFPLPPLRPCPRWSGEEKDQQRVSHLNNVLQFHVFGTCAIRWGIYYTWARYTWHSMNQRKVVWRKHEGIEWKSIKERKNEKKKRIGTINVTYQDVNTDMTWRDMTSHTYTMTCMYHDMHVSWHACTMTCMYHDMEKQKARTGDVFYE